MDKNLKNFINSKEFQTAYQNYQNNQNCNTDNSYIRELMEMNNKGIEMMKIFKERFPIDEIIQVMNYDYNKIDKNSKHYGLLKEMINYGLNREK